jgi:cytochrome c oxidase subunit 1
MTTQFERSYLNPLFSWRGWLFTTDHKRIALLYAFTITAFFFLGAFGALVVRIALLSTTAAIVPPGFYNRMFTLHGVVMVWFFLIPSIPATLGNFLVPLMIGAKDLALPRVNLLSWYLFLAGGAFTLFALLAGGLDTGWTFYTPYSTLYANGWVVAAVTGVFITGFSSILTGLNFIVSIHTMRAPGLTWMRLPLFLWSLYSTSVVLVLATPVLAMVLALLAAERLFGIGIFDPRLGGDPLLFQHLFWFYSHPAVYIMILPGMGVVSELISCFSRRKVFGYAFVAFASVAIAVLGFLLWGHHMFVAGQSAYSSLAFSILTFLIGVPSAIKVFNWALTLHKAEIRFNTPMLYALGFIWLFSLGGLTGFYLSTIAVDVHLTDTFFVIAHFHYIMVGGMLLAYLGGIHYWWPKITGRLYDEKWARVAAATLFVGFNVTFFPQFLLGYAGMPRRYATYPQEFHALNVVSTCGVAFLAVGYLLPFFYLAKSLVNGEEAGDNPWGAAGLEWTAPSPPPVHNFLTTPSVTGNVYEAYRQKEGA